MTRTVTRLIITTSTTNAVDIIRTVTSDWIDEFIGRKIMTATRAKAIAIKKCNGLATLFYNLVKTFSRGGHFFICFLVF